MCVYLHTSDGTQNVFELLLLPNNTTSETFLHKSGAVRSFDWIFIVGSEVWRYLGECVTWNTTFTFSAINR